MKKVKMLISFLLFTSSQVKAGEAPKAQDIPIYNLSQGVFRKESVCSHCKIFDFCNLENHRRCFVKVIKAYGKDKWDYPDPRCQYAPKVTSDLLY